MDQASPVKYRVIGSALMLFGSILYSSKAVIVKLAYRHEIDSLSLLALRMLFALPFYIIILFWVNRKSNQSNQSALSRRDWLKIMGIGLTGYYLASMFDFAGLQYISAGLERLILFMYPTLVVLIMAFFYRKKIAGTTFLALLLTYSGILLAFATDKSTISEEYLNLGAGLVFMAALSFALYIIWSAGLVQRVGTLRFTAIGMLTAAAAVLIHHGVLLQWDLWKYNKEVYWLSLLMAFFATVLPSFFVMEAIRRIGPTRAAIIGSVGPISTIILAYYFLGEAFGGWQLVGTGVVILGVLMISLNRKR